MKSAREKMDMVAAYFDVGSYRGAAEICGTTHRTVKREVLKHEQNGSAQKRAERAHNTDVVTELIDSRVSKTKARISAKRLLPKARAAGYSGSARNFRRAVATAKNQWRQRNHGGRRPGVWSPGETLVIDWGVEDGLHIFCAVSAWSRWRFVRFATDERAETTLAMLAECFEAMGGVPKVVLADRMACLKGAVVANIVVPTAAYVRFATHYGFRPDFCEGADPESKGLVEHLVGYSKRDLVVPGAPFGDLATANAAAGEWCDEVNAANHSEISAVPAERLVAEGELFTPLPSLRASIGRVVTRKVDKLACIRFASARYSVPVSAVAKTVEVHVVGDELRVVLLGTTLATHRLVGPGETSICDDHYGGPRPAPRRAPRPRTAAEHFIIGLGPVGEAFLKGAAAAGITKLGAELEALMGLSRSHGRDVLVAALARAVQFGRWRAVDVRSIIEAGAGVAHPTRAGEALVVEFPPVPVRPLSDYAPGGLQ